MAASIENIETYVASLHSLYNKGVPAAATAVNGVSATVGTTAITVKANADTAASIYVSMVEINDSAATTAAVTLQDTTGTPVPFWTGTIPANSSRTISFDPPVKIAAGKNFNAVKADTNGVVIVTYNGFVG